MDNRDTGLCEKKKHPFTLSQLSAPRAPSPTSMLLRNAVMSETRMGVFFRRLRSYGPHPTLKLGGKGVSICCHNGFGGMVVFFLSAEPGILLEGVSKVGLPSPMNWPSLCGSEFGFAQNGLGAKRSGCGFAECCCSLTSSLPPTD